MALFILAIIIIAHQLYSQNKIKNAPKEADIDMGAMIETWHKQDMIELKEAVKADEKRAFLKRISKLNPDESNFQSFVDMGYLKLCEENEADIKTAYLTDIEEDILQLDLFENSAQITKKETNQKYYKYVSVYLDD